MRAALSKTVETDRSNTVETPSPPIPVAAASLTPSSTDGGLARTSSICRPPNWDFTNVWKAMAPLPAPRRQSRSGEQRGRGRPQRLEHGADLAAHARDGVGAASAHDVTQPRPAAAGAGLDRRPRGVRRPGSRSASTLAGEVEQGTEALG